MIAHSTARTILGNGCLAVAIAALAACSSSVVRSSGTAPSSRAASAPRYGATVTVQRGQTLYRIASGNGISTLDLATWNNIAPPYTIYPGQRLKLFPGSGGAGPPRVATGQPRRMPPPSTAASPPRPSPTGT
ncbi:MAG: LysM peptidoglycan-binding domain-containing protein, partial [Luteimonas sp.]